MNIFCALFKYALLRFCAMRPFQICDHALLRFHAFAILRSYQFCAFAIVRFCDFCDMRFALLRNSRFCAIFMTVMISFCDIATLRYCDIAQQIADRNVADSCRRTIPRQSSHMSDPLCALMIILNDWIDY